MKGAGMMCWNYRGLVVKALFCSVLSTSLLCLSTDTFSQALSTESSGIARLNDFEDFEDIAAQAFALRQSDSDRAIDYSQTALAALPPHYDSALQPHLLNTLAIAWLQKREFTEAKAYAHQALESAERFQAHREAAKALNTLGVLHWHHGDLDEAKTWFQSSLALRKQHLLLDELSPALNNLGLIEEIQGRYNKAIDYYLQAIHYAEKLNNDVQLARPIANLGVLHQVLGNYDQAKNYYERSLDLKLKENDFVGAALAHNNMSEIHVAQKAFDKALLALTSGLDLLGGVEAKHELALLTVNKGSVLLQLKETAQALVQFDAAAAMVAGFASDEIDIYLAQGYARARLQQGLLDEALAQAQEFLILAEARKDQNSIKKAQKLRYEIYREKGAYLQALVAHESYVRIQQEQSARENTEYVSRLQAEYDSEKKEKKLAILERENTLHELEIKRQQFTQYLILALSCLALVVVTAWLRLRATRVKASLLEAKVEERTREIQQQHATISSLLAQKEKLLEHKNVLFSTVSHEFRTPLTLIVGPLKALTKQLRNKEQLQTISGIQNNATRLLRMVDQLLDLARIDMQANTASEAVDVSEVVGFLVASMETLFKENDLTCTKSLREDIWVNISPDALEKIVVNLLSNAVKYTPASGKITVTTECRTDQVVIAVKDNGIGIPHDQQSRVFERFTRLDSQLYSPLAKPVPGAGVGLALVKELVERYEGQVELESSVNSGSCFQVCFPLAAAPELKKSKPLHSLTCETELVNLQTQSALNKAGKIKALQHAESVALPRDTKTILIVEDNEEMRAFIGACLQPNYQCLFANNGNQGVNMAIKEIPDLIVTDLMMPEMTGLELACVLREEQLTSHIPIIMLTAKGDPESRHAAWRQQVDEYIEKPFDGEELLLRCDNIINIRQLLAEKFSEQIGQQRNDSKNGVPASTAVSDSKTTLDEADSQNINARFNKSDRDFMEKLTRYLESNYGESQLTAKKISSALAITEKQLQRKLKALTNDSIPAYVRHFRLKKGAELLAKGVSITSVAFDTGFSSQSYFSTAFATRYGCSPSDYQQQQRRQFEKRAGAKAG